MILKFIILLVLILNSSSSSFLPTSQPSDFHTLPDFDPTLVNESQEPTKPQISSMSSLQTCLTRCTSSPMHASRSWSQLLLDPSRSAEWYLLKNRILFDDDDGVYDSVITISDLSEAMIKRVFDGVDFEESLGHTEFEDLYYDLDDLSLRLPWSTTFLYLSSLTTMHEDLIADLTNECYDNCSTEYPMVFDFDSELEGFPELDMWVVGMLNGGIDLVNGSVGQIVDALVYEFDAVGWWGDEHDNGKREGSGSMLFQEGFDKIVSGSLLTMSSHSIYQNFTSMLRNHYPIETTLTSLQSAPGADERTFTLTLYYIGGDSWSLSVVTLTACTAVNGLKFVHLSAHPVNSSKRYESYTRGLPSVLLASCATTDIDLCLYNWDVTGTIHPLECCMSASFSPWPLCASPLWSVGHFQEWISEAIQSDVFPDGYSSIDFYDNVAFGRCEGERGGGLDFLFSGYEERQFDIYCSGEEIEEVVYEYDHDYDYEMGDYEEGKWIKSKSTPPSQTSSNPNTFTNRKRFWVPEVGWVSAEEDPWSENEIFALLFILLFLTAYFYGLSYLKKKEQKKEKERLLELVQSVNANKEGGGDKKAANNSNSKAQKVKKKGKKPIANIIKPVSQSTKEDDEKRQTTQANVRQKEVEFKLRAKERQDALQIEYDAKIKEEKEFARQTKAAEVIKAVNISGESSNSESSGSEKKVEKKDEKKVEKVAIVDVEPAVVVLPQAQPRVQAQAQAQAQPKPQQSQPTPAPQPRPRPQILIPKANATQSINKINDKPSSPTISSSTSTSTKTDMQRHHHNQLLKQQHEQAEQQAQFHALQQQQQQSQQMHLRQQQQRQQEELRVLQQRQLEMEILQQGPGQGLELGLGLGQELGGLQRDRSGSTTSSSVHSYSSEPVKQSPIHTNSKARSRSHSNSNSNTSSVGRPPIPLPTPPTPTSPLPSPNRSSTTWQAAQLAKDRPSEKAARTFSQNFAYPDPSKQASDSGSADTVADAVSSSPILTGLKHTWASSSSSRPSPPSSSYNASPFGSPIGRAPSNSGADLPSIPSMNLASSLAPTQWMNQVFDGNDSKTSTSNPWHAPNDMSRRSSSSSTTLPLPLPLPLPPLPPPPGLDARHSNHQYDLSPPQYDRDLHYQQQQNEQNQNQNQQPNYHYQYQQTQQQHEMQRNQQYEAQAYNDNQPYEHQYELPAQQQQAPWILHANLGKLSGAMQEAADRAAAEAILEGTPSQSSDAEVLKGSTLLKDSTLLGTDNGTFSPARRVSITSSSRATRANADLDAMLASLNLSHLSATFTVNECDYDSLKLMGEDDLREMGIAKGPRVKLIKRVQAELYGFSAGGGSGGKGGSKKNGSGNDNGVQDNPSVTSSELSSVYDFNR